MNNLNKEQLRSNLDNIIWNIEEARITVSEHHIVKLVTVAKYTTIENILTLYELGQRAFGENQIQQLKERMATLEDLPHRMASHRLITKKQNQQSHRPTPYPHALS